MKQVLQTRTGLTVVRSVPTPQCPSGSILVRNEYSVISSGTERARVARAQKTLIKRARERPDLVRSVVEHVRREGIKSTREAVHRKLTEESAIGYSSAGHVIEVGAETRGFAVGGLVSCAGVGHANHAEIVSVPANLCARVPPGVAPEAAAFATIGAIALHGVRLGNVTLGERVAVVGCGLVGQIACQLLGAAGAWVAAVDVNTKPVREALSNGADLGATIDENPAALIGVATDGVGVDCVLVTAAAATNDPLLLAAQIVRQRGTIILIGDVPVDVPRAPFYLKEILFRISRSYGPGRYDLEYEERGLDYPIGYVRWTEKRNMEAILDLQNRGRIDLTRLIDDIVSVDDAPLGFDRLVRGEVRGAVLLQYEPEPDAAPTEVDPPQGIGSPDGVPRIGLIGPGGFAKSVIVPAFLAAGAKLEVVAGGSGPSAEAAVRSGDFSRIAPSPKALIADSSIDAVAICTRHGDHALLAAAALDAGKHVFCEKPLAVDLAGLDVVLASASHSGPVLAVGFNRRFSPLLVELREVLRSGSRGPITAIYRVAAGAVPSDNWVHDLAEGGGRAIGEGCHFVDSLAFLVDAPIVRVAAAGHGLPDLPVQAHDNLVVTLWFEDGSIGSIVYVAAGGGGLAKERIEVFAPATSAVLDDYSRLEFFGANVPKAHELRQADKGHKAEISAFVEAIRTGIPPVPIPVIANVSAATLAIVESLRTSLPIEIIARDVAEGCNEASA